MRVARAVLFRVVFILSTIIAGLVLAPLLLVLKPRHVRLIVVVWQNYVLLLLRLIVGLRLRVEGPRPTAPVIFAAKHQSALETLAFHAAFPETAVFVKRELKAIPIFGWYLIAAGNIPVDRSGGASALKALVRAGNAALADGMHLLIFPEGTRVAPGEQLPLQPGIAALYTQLRCPVVPVVVDTGAYWGKGFTALFPGESRIVLLESIPPGLDRKAFTTLLQASLHEGDARLQSPTAES